MSDATTRGLPDGYEMVIGLEVHAELATATKMFCGCPNQFGDEPNTNVVPGVPRPARVAAGAQRAGRRARHAARPGPALRGASRRCSPGRTTSIRTCRRTTRSPSTTSRSTSTATSTCPTAPASASSGPTSRRTPASPPTSAARGQRSHPRRRLLARRLQPLRRAAGRDRVAARPPHRPSRPRPTSPSCAPSSSPPACPTPRWRRGRCGSTPTCRSASPATEFGTRCEIKNLNSIRSLGRAIDYEARRQIDLHRVRRAGRPADPPLERGRRPHAHAALEGGGRGLPLLPRARPRAARPRRPRSIAAIDAALPPLPGRPPRRAGRRRPASTLPDDGVVDHRRPRPRRSGARRHRRRRRRRPHAHPRRSTTSPSTAPTTSRPPTSPTLVAHGDARRAHRHPGQAGAGRHGRHRQAAGRHRRRARVRGDGHRRAREPGRRLIAANPDEWQRFCDGDGKMQGFFVGQVMKETKGQADGKVVNQLLQQRKG